MNRTLVCVIAAMAVTISALVEGADGPNLDVAGLKIGVGVNAGAQKRSMKHRRITQQ